MSSKAHSHTMQKGSKRSRIHGLCGLCGLCLLPPAVVAVLAVASVACDGSGSCCGEEACGTSSGAAVVIIEYGTSTGKGAGTCTSMTMYSVLFAGSSKDMGHSCCGLLLQASVSMLWLVLVLAVSPM